MTTHRVALYWTPNPADPLARCGAAWLGWDAETGVAPVQPDIPGLADATRTPRRYGLHATLRPPIRLATGWEEFIGVAQAVADATAPFDMPALVVDDMDGFLALREATPCPALHRLADACLLATDRLRLRADAAETARRRAAILSAEQDGLLLRWGYPYVLQAWRFHVTLTGRLDAPTTARLRPLAEQHLAEALARPRRVQAVSVCTQVEGGSFLVAERMGLGG